MGTNKDATSLEELRQRVTVTVPEAAAILGIGKNLAYAAVKSGDIPAVKLGRRLVVPVGALLKMLDIEQR